ncbi:M16 family metallopeptidase [Elusimicrobiota bacterium]
MYTLDNGIRVLLYPKHDFPGIAFRVFFRIGAADEDMGESGLAHMLEHVAFKGTQTFNSKDFKNEKKVLAETEAIAKLINQEISKTTPDKENLKKLKTQLEDKEKELENYIIKDEYEKFYEKLGAWGFNAFTTHDITGYIVSLPSNKLDAWLIAESDRFRNPVFREFYRERNVVMEERRMSVESHPVNKLYELYLGSAFLMSPYRREIIGSMADIERFTATKAMRFFESRYIPERCVISLVGDFDPDPTIKKIKNHFGGISPKKPWIDYPGNEPEQKGEKRIELVWDAEPSMIIGWHKPNAPHADDSKFVFLKAVLNEGWTSRFYKNLVEKKQMAQSIDIWHDDPGSRYPNMLTIFADSRAPYTINELEKAIEEQILALKTNPPQAWEMERVKNKLKADLITNLERNEGFADALAWNEALYDNWAYSWDLLEEFERITSQDIVEIVNKYIKKENKVVAYITKKGK